MISLQNKRNILKIARYPLLILCSLIFISLRIAGYHEPPDQVFHDAFFRYRAFIAQGKAESPVVLVGIDKAALDANRKPLIFWGSDLAELISVIRSAGAKVIVMDILHLADLNAYRPSEKAQRMETVVLSTGNLVVPYAIRGDYIDLPYYLLNKFREQFYLEEKAPAKQSVIMINAAERRFGTGFGFSNLIADRDGIVRRAQLIDLYDGIPVASLGFKSVMRYLGAVMRDVKGDDTGLSVKGINIPQYGGGMIINYPGPPGTFPALSMKLVMSKKDDPAAMSHWFDKKVVVIGAYDELLMDTHNTPYLGSGIGSSGVMYGMEIVASIIDTVVQGRFITHESVATACIIIFLMCSLGFFMAGMQRLRGIFLMAAAIPLYVIACLAVFLVSGLQAGVAIPFLAMLAGFAARYVFEHFLVGRDRKLLGETLKSYIDPRVVDLLVARGDTEILKGRKREVTVLFSDIRNFTALSEKMENPEHVVELLNIYLPLMTGLIMEEEGCVDKFIGDGIMAFWNAPNEVEGHASHAVRCALRMQGMMAEVNERIKAAGINLADPLRIGIGIHTGHAVVGNIGSEVKHDYTAIGDAVNQASRLEGKTKDMGSSIVISESVYLLAKDGGFTFRDLGDVQVKGKEQRIKVYGVNI